MNILWENMQAMKRSFQTTVLKHLLRLEVWWQTCLRVLLAVRTLYGTIIQVSATAFCSAWVNTNSISVSGNSQVASWQDFWAEWKSIARGYMYSRVCVCVCVCVCLFVCARVCSSKTHILAKQRADCFISLKLKLPVFPTFLSLHILTPQF